MPETPYTVSDVMTQNVVAVDSEAPFKEIVELLDRWKVSALPVLADEGLLVGLVSEADLLPKEEFRDTGGPGDPGDPRDPADRAKAGAVTVGGPMSSPAVTVHADASLAETARIMARRHVKRLPVVDAVGLLQGMVSRSDLLKGFLHTDGEITADVPDPAARHRAPLRVRGRGCGHAEQLAARPHPGARDRAGGAGGAGGAGDRGCRGRPARAHPPMKDPADEPLGRPMRYLEGR